MPTELLEEIERGGGKDMKAAIEITGELKRRDFKPRVAFDKKWFTPRELKVLARIAEFFSYPMKEFSSRRPTPWQKQRPIPVTASFAWV